MKLKTDNETILAIVLLLITLTVLNMFVLGGQIRDNEALLYQLESRMEILRDYEIATLNVAYTIRNMLEWEFDYYHYIP